MFWGGEGLNWACLLPRQHLIKRNMQSRTGAATFTPGLFECRVPKYHDRDQKTETSITQAVSTRTLGSSAREMVIQDYLNGY